MTENEDYEDWDEESEEWSPEWYPFPENQDKLVEKKWIRYMGPLGGTGWQSTKDPEVIRYQEDMPHEKEEGQSPHQSLHPKKEATFDREEMMERYAKRWLANSPKGSKIYITKLAKGEEYVKTGGWRVELFYPRIRNEKDMMKQAYYHLYENWVAPDMAQVHEASRFTQKMFMEASGMTDEEGRVLLTMEKAWTGGDVQQMRNTLASATTGILPPQFGPYRGQSIYSNESRSALKKWKDVYWKYLQHIVKEGLDSMMKKDEASRNWPPHKTIKNIKKAIDKNGNIRLFRGIKVPLREWEQLKEGKNARMVLNNLDSWSVEDEVAKGFAYVATSSSLPTTVPVVLEYKASPEEIASGWPFVGYVNEAEFILNLSKNQNYRITSIKEGPYKKRLASKNPWLVTMEKVAPLTDEELAAEMARHRQKSSPVIFDLTGDNDWATMRDENGALGKKRIRETEEVVVATYGSTPWSEDKPPRPDRPKKKEKVIISEYVKKYRWEGPKKGPRGGTYMISPGGKKVYDKSKWPAADRAAAEQAAKPKSKLKPMPIEGWDFFEQVEGSAFTIGAVSGEVIKVPTNFMIYHRVTPDGSDLTLKIDMGVNPGLAKEMTDMISSVYEHLPSMLLKHNKVINILRDIQSPGMPARFGTFAQNLGKYGQRYSEIELNARLFRQVDSIEGRYAKWDEILAHEMAHGMVRGMTGHQNPTFMPHIDSMMDYIEAFTDDAVANMKDVKTEEGEDLIDQPNALRRELAFISRYAFNSANVYEWEKSTLANIPGDSYSIDSLVEDIAETIGYMATNVEKFGGLDEFVKRYPNRVAWYEKWVLGGRLWQGPRQ
jgi:hypothetical protein